MKASGDRRGTHDQPSPEGSRSAGRRNASGSLPCACPTTGGLSPAPSCRIPTRSVIPAALTPFSPSLEVDWAQFRRHVEALAAVQGVTAVMVNGAAGQAGALSRQERRHLLETAIRTIGDRTPTLAALGETAGIAIEDLARDATESGADAVLIMPPSDPADFEMARALARFQRVFDATDLPVAFYQTRYAPETVTALAALPRVFAIKEGNGSPAVFERNLRSVRALGRGVAVWSTHSSWLLADLATGADGILSGMGSVAADLQAALAAAVWRSDLDAARRISDRLFPQTQVFYRGGGDAHTRMKVALVLLGRWTCESVRPPLNPVSGAERDDIARALGAPGLMA